MFERVDGAGLLAEMAGAQRAERVAVARRLLAAGRLCQLRMADVDDADRLQWCIDNWEAVAAEVGAELGISRGRASSQMNYGVELLERLPALAAVFAAGEVDFRVIATVVFRTGLITDPAVLAGIDAALAVRAPRWNAHSRARVADLVDWWVRAADPAAVRLTRSAEADRHIEFGPTRDGMTEFWGALRAPEAAALDRRLDQLIATVCRADPRTKPQKRADALIALSAGQTAMPCECGGQDCPARDTGCDIAAAAPAPIVIHLLAEAATITGDSDAPAYLPGHGAIPAADVRTLAARAQLRPLARPQDLRAEPRYHPSVALAAFVKARDLSCRFPGCDKPAELCDIDHTIPWSAGGPTHPSNLKLLCRLHHLTKTFWTAWHDVQQPDGTVTWTSPSGRTYTTTPGGALFFPQLAVPTESITQTFERPDSTGRTQRMPTRRRSRADERAARIRWERGVNQARMNADPPPF